MIITEIHIEGFGVFNEFSLTGLDKGVNIILGSNEAGKSTLLKFLKFTLFGYPRSLNQRMPPLRGGSHGGRISAVLESGEKVLFERSATNNISLRYNGREQQNESLWSQLLGNASADLYKNVYAFSLDELVDLGSLRESGVEDKIFSVGLGLGNTSLGEVENSIQSRIDEIYKPRGNKQLIPAILKETGSKQLKIRQIQENLPMHRDLAREMDRLKEEIAGLDKELRKLKGEIYRLENYLKCYDSYVSIKKASRELKNLPALQDYPVNGMERLERLEEKEAELMDRIQKLLDGTKEEKGLSELKKTIEGISFNANLLEKQDTVDYLRSNVERYKKEIADSHEDKRNINRYQRLIKEGIDNINSEWSESNIVGFEGSTIHKDKVGAYKNDLERMANEKTGLEAQLRIALEREGRLDTKSMSNIISALALLGGGVAFFYGLYALGGALVLVALILFFGKKYYLKESLTIRTRRELERLKVEEQAIEEAYVRYLEQQLGLPKTLSPAATLQVFGIIEGLKEKIRERDTLNERLENERLAHIREFENQIKELKELPTSVKGDGSVEVLVNKIIAEFDKSVALRQEKNKWQEELGRKQRDLDNTRMKLKQVQAEIDGILRSIDAKDKQDFEKKYAENNKVREFNRKKQEATQTIEQIIGLNKADAVVDYLDQNEKSAIESKLSELALEHESIDEQSKEIRHELGEKTNQVRHIEGESELAELLTELETEKQKLKNAGKEWVSNKVALKILQDVKAKYENEKQPQVIKSSSNYFHKITRGRYKKILVSLDKQDVAVFDAKEASKKIGQLSRGTKEQLLISLRLGFIEEYEKEAEPLPVIVDEVLVNFDPDRAGQMAEILWQFGKDRQVLMFTCHPATKDYFAGADVNLIPID